MERREESLTAEPQKESLSDSKDGQPRDNTSVAVSESAQQKDCEVVSVPPYNKKIRRDRVKGRNIPDPTPSGPSQHSSNTQ